MNKLLGGLLVVSLLSSPMTKIDFIAYELLKAGHTIIKRAEDYTEERQVAREDVDSALASINNNSRCLNALLSEKTYALEKVKTVMDSKIRSNQAMTEKQMEEFKAFNDSLAKENETLKSRLKNIKSNDAINDAMNELLDDRTDYNLVYNWLSVIYENQCEAICSLNSMILSCEGLLEVL